MLLGVCLVECSAQTNYYVSTSGNDSSSGTSPGEAWKTISKLNEQSFNQGDHIFFERGGTWLGMLHLKGSGSPSQPIVVSAFGDEDLDNPSIDGDGFQAAILIYNDSHITIEHLTFYFKFFDYFGNT